MKARRTRLKLIYEGTDISKDVAGDLELFEYNDNESGTADDITIRLNNTSGRWSGAWFPGKGDTLQATIIDDNGELFCGTFKIDDLVSNLSPKSFEIKAVSVPLVQSIRRTAKSRTWEDVKLSGIVDEIAAIGNLRVIYDVSRDPTYDRLSQHEETDLKLLQRLCESEGFSLKVTDNQLVVFEQKEYESKAVVDTIEDGVTDILNGGFRSQAFDLYKSCTVAYWDTDQEEEIEVTVHAPNVSEGMEHRMVRRANSLGEAQRWGMAQLRRMNSHEVTADLTLRGKTSLVAGITLDTKGFGKYDGKYMIEKASHRVLNGYQVQLSLRRVLEGY